MLNSLFKEKTTKLKECATLGEKYHPCFHYSKITIVNVLIYLIYLERWTCLSSVQPSKSSERRFPTSELKQNSNGIESYQTDLG